MPVVPKAATKNTGILNGLSDKVLAAFKNEKSGRASDENETAEMAAASAPVQRSANGGVVVDASRRVAVPTFEGIALRAVIEKADAAGLRVQAVGSGLAREQVPAPGTIVPAGTEVVVRFVH
jgi:cell division protein FtsI (penicillin-binding protein 3)